MRTHELITLDVLCCAGEVRVGAATRLAQYVLLWAKSLKGRKSETEEGRHALSVLELMCL